MTHGSFLRADLASIAPARACLFYEQFFRWRFDGYVASTSRGEVAMLYEMSEAFLARTYQRFG